MNLPLSPLNHHDLVCSGMGLSCSSTAGSNFEEVVKAKDATQLIERRLRADEKRRNKEIKILLLGSGGSGKSTVLKVMRLLHQLDFTESELEEYRALIYRNIIEALHVLLEFCVELDIRLDPTIVPFAEAISAIPYHPGYKASGSELFPQDVKVAAERLWADSGVQAGWLKARQVAAPENLPYLMESMDRFWAEGYKPSELDILQARAKTTGISETRFPVQDYMYLMVDVGGQRSERRKWLHCFDSVNAILFVVNLAGYDEALVEDRDANQTRDALLLFQSILTNPLFQQTCFLLFLNKIDLFSLKVRSLLHPIHACFSDYPQEEEGDVSKGREFFRKKFLRLASPRRGATEDGLLGGGEGSGRGMVYSHFTCAVDKNSMRVIMIAVQDVIIRASIKDLGLM